LCEVLLVGHEMDENTLGEVALQPGAHPLDVRTAGKNIRFIGAVTDGRGSSPVALVTLMVAP
jgi:hypothetical protein